MILNHLTSYTYSCINAIVAREIGCQRKNGTSNFPSNLLTFNTPRDLIDVFCPGIHRDIEEVVQQTQNPEGLVEQNSPKWKQISKAGQLSYGQNLVHGEGTSLSRVGPYRFCSDGKNTTLSIQLWSYLILSDTQLLSVVSHQQLLQVNFSRRRGESNTKRNMTTQSPKPKTSLKLSAHMYLNLHWAPTPSSVLKTFKVS